MLTIPYLLAESITRFAQRPALGFISEDTLSYKQLNENILRCLSFLKKKGIAKGDKVLLWGPNSPEWGVIHLATTSLGAVIVPILPELTIDMTENIFIHSDAKISFISSTKLKEHKESKLFFYNCYEIDNLFQIISDEDCLGNINDANVLEDDLAALIYTSGTTGNPKGVMLSHKNICFVAKGSYTFQKIDCNSRFLSMLPLAHTYENTIGFLYPLFYGSRIYFLRRVPSPGVLIQTLQVVKPTHILSVPLIIEKIYRQRIKPEFSKTKFISFLYNFDLFKKGFHYLAGLKLKKTFGGKLVFFGIGGAALNDEVEKFLRDGKFPYAIGYGLTETAPLLAGSKPHKTAFRSTGKPLVGVKIKINEADQISGEGEIWAKGDNLMRGYFKDEAETSKVVTPDRWFKTGDLGCIDKKGNLYIKGRLKSVIIGANGKNIYPEEIEAIINNFDTVNDSLVLERKGRLVAIVQYNSELLEEKYKSFKEDFSEKMDEISERLRTEIKIYVNNRLSALMQIAEIELQTIPFEKTATLKIKRYLYS